MGDFLKLGTVQYSYLWDYSLEHSLLDINMASPNPGMRGESVKQILDQITWAHDLGAKIIVVMLGKRHPLLAPPVEMVWERFAREGVLRCVEHAERSEVIFGLENGPSLFIDRSELMLFVLDEVKSPWMKIVFDVANVSMLESMIPALDLLKDHLAHVHLSDTDGMKWTHSPIGMGTIDFALIAEKLTEMHFSGVSILETTHAENPKWGIVNSIEKLTPLGWRMYI